MREQPLETAGFAGSKAALPPSAALHEKRSFEVEVVLEKKTAQGVTYSLHTKQSCSSEVL